jgi:hypothetical protein
MLNKFTTILLLTLFGIAGIANSAEGYKCKVLMAKSLTKAGEMAKTGYSNIYVGKEFVVDINTGRMIGAISNGNHTAQPTVLDRGSKDQGYKVITIYKPFVSVDYLNVEEFTNSPEKPFMFIESSTVISGICRHM